MNCLGAKDVVNTYPFSQGETKGAFKVFVYQRLIGLLVWGVWYTLYGNDVENKIKINARSSNYFWLGHKNMIRS